MTIKTQTKDFGVSEGLLTLRVRLDLQSAKTDVQVFILRC